MIILSCKMSILSCIYDIWYDFILFISRWLEIISIWWYNTYYPPCKHTYNDRPSAPPYNEIGFTTWNKSKTRIRQLVLYNNSINIYGSRSTLQCFNASLNSFLRMASLAAFSSALISFASISTLQNYMINQNTHNVKFISWK